MRLPVTLTFLSCTFLASLAHAGAVSYQYTGLDFSCTDGGCGYTAPYVASDSLQGTLTLPQALGANLDGSTPVTYTSFSFNDGGLFPSSAPLTDANSDGAAFNFTTDGSGNITAFNFSITFPASSPFGYMSSGIFGDSTGYYFTPDYGYNSTQGTFSVGGSSASTPEPASIALLGSGLLTLALRRWIR